MTCIIAAKDKDGSIYMAGDSMVSGYVTDTIIGGKVFKIGEWLIGVAGDARDGQVIQHAFVPPDIPSDVTIDGYMVSTFAAAVRSTLEKAGRLCKENGKEGSGLYLLVAGRGKIWMMCSDFGITCSRSPFIAIGSGSDFALGAMQVSAGVPMRERLLAALRASERWCESVRRPFVVKKIKASCF